MSVVANLTEGISKQILLLAPNLLGESLSIQLTEANPKLEIFLKKEEMTRHPCLVIWSVENIDMPSAIQLEIRRLREYWKPAPVLLLIPGNTKLTSSEFLQFDCPGLLQDPSLKTLKESIEILRGGGRVIRLKTQLPEKTRSNTSPMGLGQWLLLSGVQEINNELQNVEFLLDQPPQNPLKEFILYGRKRELNASRDFLYWLWGPFQISLDPQEGNKDSFSKSGIIASSYPSQEGLGINIKLDKRDPISVWAAIKKRLENTIQQGLTNSTGTLLAIEGLNTGRQKDLLLGLLNQLDEVIDKLRSNEKPQDSYKKNWLEMQPELRQQALREMAGNYVRLPFKGELAPVGEFLLKMVDLFDNDDELPKPEHMLDPLLTNKPLIVEGQLLPADDPRALIQLEMFFSNWLIRSAELICAEVMSACGEWPELRRYLLNPHLVSTRELERLRNQLNSQTRWQSLIQKPIQLYESKRLFYRLREGRIEPILITEPRDEELRQLGWWQQQVALLVEARDAITPQIQALVRRLGNVMVIVLTKVIGRAIGLIGRGIAQGMGRSLGRN